MTEDGTSPKIGWVSDYDGDTKKSEEELMKIDKAMHNRGYMKGPETQAENVNKDRLARDQSNHLRRIVATEYLENGKDYYIPYSKIVDVGIKTTFSRKEVYFDVKTSSPHRHRYSARTADKKNSEFTDNAYKLLMLMTGITQISR